MTLPELSEVKKKEKHWGEKRESVDGKRSMISPLYSPAHSRSPPPSGWSVWFMIHHEAVHEVDSSSSSLSTPLPLSLSDVVACTIVSQSSHSGLISLPACFPLHVFVYLYMLFTPLILCPLSLHFSVLSPISCVFTLCDLCMHSE